MRLDAAIADAAERLSRVSDSARLDAEILLCQTIDMPRSYLFAHPEDVLDELTRDRFETLMLRRLNGEPMSYITGTREFWSHELLVSPATLVPRPETELLVELALREIPRNAEWQILDLGTGSGAVAIAIAGERLMCKITATDISPDALAVARENVRHAQMSNITLLEGSWIAPVAGSKFELFGVFVSYHQVVVIVVAILVAVGLRLFLYNTRGGVAMRAVVSNRGLLQLNGGHPGRASSASWATPRYRHRRQTSPWVSAMKRSSAARSPSRAARRTPVRWSTAPLSLRKRRMQQ